MAIFKKKETIKAPAFTVADVDAYVNLYRHEIPKMFLEHKQSFLSILDSNPDQALETLLNNSFKAAGSASLCPAKLMKYSKAQLPDEVLMTKINCGVLNATDHRGQIVKSNEPATLFMFSCKGDILFRAYLVEPTTDADGHRAYLYYLCNENGENTPFSGNVVNDLQKQIAFFFNNYDTDLESIRRSNIPAIKRKEFNRHPERNDNSAQYFQEKDKAYFDFQVSAFPALLFKYRATLLTQLLQGGVGYFADLTNSYLANIGYDGTIADNYFKVESFSFQFGIRCICLTFPILGVYSVTGNLVSVQHVARAYIFYNADMNFFRYYTVEPQRNAKGEPFLQFNEVNRRGEYFHLGTATISGADREMDYFYSKFKTDVDTENI